MSGIRRVKVGALVYEATDTNIAGGTLVIPSTTAATLPGKQGMQIAGDAAIDCLGICINDVVTAANQEALQYPTGPAPMSAQGMDLTVPDVTSTVENDGVFPAVYTAVAVAYGRPLACAAGGKVREWVAGDGAAANIGWCAQVGGMSAAGGIGLARILR
jgi:hypothetical protein